MNFGQGCIAAGNHAQGGQGTGRAPSPGLLRRPRCHDTLDPPLPSLLDAQCGQGAHWHLVPGPQPLRALVGLPCRASTPRR